MDQCATKFTPGVRSAGNSDSVLSWTLGILLTIVAVHALFWLVVGARQPLGDLHQFRQTQTAITAYWIWQEGPRLAYETPVLGYPWSVPLEFPLYQYLLAALRWMGVPLTEGGRLLSSVFYLGLLWPLNILRKNLGLRRTDYLILSILLLASPMYIYWSRTVMIESAVLFLSLCWLAFLLQYVRTQRQRDAVIAIVFGILAVNTKLTTFAIFGMIGGGLFLATAYRTYREGFSDRNFRSLLGLAVIGLVPVATGLFWVVYSDYVKDLNPLGRALTSRALRTWNFGTLEQRLAPQLWLETIVGRAIPDVLGSCALAGLATLAAAIGSKRYMRLVVLSIGGFLAPMLVFTNLHIVHNYYQYANGLFLLAAVSFGLAGIAYSGKRALAVALLVLVVAGQLIRFHAGFAGIIAADVSDNRELKVGRLVRGMTRTDDALLVIGSEWNSAIPYEAERKAVMLSRMLAPFLVRDVLAHPGDFLGGMRLGAIVYCADGAQSLQADQRDLQYFVSGRKTLAEVEGCQILSPSIS
jgi:hypothetical protein